MNKRSHLRKTDLCGGSVGFIEMVNKDFAGITDASSLDTVDQAGSIAADDTIVSL